VRGTSAAQRDLARVNPEVVPGAVRTKRLRRDVARALSRDQTRLVESQSLAAEAGWASSTRRGLGPPWRATTGRRGPAAKEQHRRIWHW